MSCKEKQSNCQVPGTINHNYYYCCCCGKGDGSTNPGTTQPSDKFNMQMYDVAGVYTFTAPVTGKYKVTVVGAGGGGGGAYSDSASKSTAIGGGGGGGHAVKIVDLNAYEIVSVTVGVGGNGGTSSVNAVNGGSSSFGQFCSATGGFGSTSKSSTNSSSNSFPYLGAGYPGGIGVDGDINGKGGHGANPIVGNPSLANSGGYSGAGGGSIFSGGAAAANNQDGIDGMLGAGGSGGDCTSTPGDRTGGKGGDGAVLIEW